MSQAGANSNTGSGAATVETLTGNSGGAVGPDGAFNINILANTTMGIDTVGTPASNQINIVGIQADTTQIGVAEMATAVETGQLSDATLTVTPNSLEPILVSPYVVAPGGAYTTIQLALDAANAAGGGTVYVRGGTYTEDLTLYDGVHIIGYSESATVIDGTHTPPTTGVVNIFRVTMFDSTAVFSSAAAGSSTLLIEDSTLYAVNGYTFDLLNWTGTVALDDIGPGGTNDGFFRNTGGATLFVISGTLGAGSANSMITSGSVLLGEVELNCPWDAQTGSVIECDYGQFSQETTLSNNASGIFDFCRWDTGASASITMSSSGSITISNSIVDSSNNPSIDGAGAGTLNLNQVSFLDNANIAGTLTLGTSSVYPVSMTNGQILIGSSGQPAVPATLTAGSNISIANGAGSITISANGGGELAITSLDNTDSPYTVLSADEYLSCDVSLGVLTVQLPNVPTTGRVIIVKDSAGNSATNNITVTTVGGVVTIDGSTSFVMNTDYEAANFIFNGTSYEVY